MRIGIASPLSCFYLKDYLYPESAEIASHLSNHDAPAVTSLILGFLNKGHNIVAFTKDPETSKSYVLEGASLRIYVIPSLHKGWRKLLNRLLITDSRLIIKMWLSKESVDVMSVHWTRDYAFGARHWIGKCPVTVTVRDVIPVISKLQPIGWSTKMWNGLTMNNKHFHFIANSDYTRDMVKQIWGKETRVINNSVSCMFLDYKEESKNDCFTFVCITTSIDDRKNIDTLLYSFKMFHEQVPNSSLMLVGPCFVRDNASVKKWGQNGLLEGVVLNGRKDGNEIKSILTKAHCLVHPSREETFGNILIEAMACKCLTIGGENSGAVPYVLRQGKLGILCNVNNTESLKEAMLNAYKGCNDDMIKKAFRLVHTKYTPEKICKDYLDFFQQLTS